MRFATTLWSLGLIVSSAAFAQSPSLDQSTLTGKFNFIYGVYQRSSASVETGSLSFDGRGHYTIVTDGGTSQGAYHVNLDGTGSLTNWLDPTRPPLSVRMGAGVSVFGASTLEQSTTDQHDMLLAVPAADKQPAMSGPWGGVNFLYTPGPPVLSRAGRFRLAFDASGNVNSTGWTYHESDMNNGALQDITSAGTYSVDANGVSRQSEKFLFGQSRKFLLTAARLEGWNGSR